MTSRWFGPHNRSYTQNFPIATGLTFPRIALAAVGGDQGYGSSAANNFPAWTTSPVGSATYNFVQQVGAYDLVVLNGTFENWDSGGKRDREDLTQALLKNTTYTVTLNRSRPCLAFYYAIMCAGQLTGGPQQTYLNLVQANNWWLYESAGGVGTVTPSGGGNSFINYSTAWPTGIGSAGAGASICGSNYGTTSTGSPTGPQGPARTFGNYNATKLLIRNSAGIDSRFTFDAQMASPSCAGVFLDDCFIALDGAGSVPNSSLDGITIAPGSQQGGGFPALDTVQPVMARGNHNFFDQLNTMTATFGSLASKFYNFANFGQYCNVYQFGNSIIGAGLDNTLHGGLMEDVFGAGASSWEFFQAGGGHPSGWLSVLTNYYAGLDFCVQPSWWNPVTMGLFRPLVCMGTKLPAADGSSTASWAVNGTLTNITAGSVLEYQYMRYALCTTLLGDGFFMNGTAGYDWSKPRWYDEYGDDSLTQVNVPRGYLGLPTQVRPTSAAFALGPLGVWKRTFQNGTIYVNPRGNGVQTISATGTALQGTQQPTINNGAHVTSITLQDGDGRILLN